MVRIEQSRYCFPNGSCERGRAQFTKIWIESCFHKEIIQVITSQVLPCRFDHDRMIWLGMSQIAINSNPISHTTRSKYSATEIEIDRFGKFANWSLYTRLLNLQTLSQYPVLMMSTIQLKYSPLKEAPEIIRREKEIPFYIGARHRVDIAPWLKLQQQGYHTLLVRCRWKSIQVRIG